MPGPAVVQAVCSPIRNPMPRGIRIMTGLMPAGWCARCGSWRGTPPVPDPAYPWRVTHGPWYENCLALVTVAGAASDTWEAGVVEADRHDQPEIRRVARVSRQPELRRVRRGLLRLDAALGTAPGDGLRVR